MASKGRRQKRPAASAPTPMPPGPPATVHKGTPKWLLPLLLVTTLAAYYPAWFGGLLWDDAAHLVAPELRSLDGLWRLWFEPGARQQFYPVTDTAFWVLHKLWGDQTLGYHLVNIVLHALSAFTLTVLLRRLGVPGAALAGVIFALHPVHVESVAWISELKNTLSGFLYLLAAVTYIAFDETKSRRQYGAALLLFALALLAKTVTATLPAALLVVLWWKRGRLAWADVRPLTPMLVLGAAAGLGTAWLERTHVGAEGIEFQLSLLERVLIAGRALWFYAAKLLWPSNLMFIYPRWEISLTAPSQYLFPIGFFILIAGCWMIRQWSRAPLAAALIFAGTLFPALGFIDVYPFRFSFVADHFQYLASIAPIALFSALCVALARQRLPAASARPVLMTALGIPLAVLTWQQSHHYVNAETLYRSTLAKNPGCWMCHNNLAAMDLREGRLTQALAHLDAGLRVNARIAEAHDNRGVVLRMLGRRSEALAAHEKAVTLAPSFPRAHFNLGTEYEAAGRLEDALRHYREALRLDSRDAHAHVNAGAVLQRLGRMEEAVRHLSAAVQLQPGESKAHDYLGMAVARTQGFAHGLAHFDTALQADPANLSARNNRATALLALDKFADAIVDYRRVLEATPTDPRAHDNLAFALFHAGQPDQALAHTSQALRLDPHYAAAHVTAGTILLRTGRASAAIPHFEAALARPTGVDVAQVHCELGAALAMVGRRALAIAEFREALRLRPNHPEAQSQLARLSR